jgi:hypothetical protein
LIGAGDTSKAISAFCVTQAEAPQEAKAGRHRQGWIELQVVELERMS